MSYTLTINVNSLEELDNLVMQLRGEQIIAAETDPKAKGKITSIAIGTSGPGSKPEVKIEVEGASSELTYQDVKNAVLEVAKTKGREASLDLLAEFNTDELSVVAGEGNERKGDVGKLKPYPDLWPKVIARAKEVSA